MSSYLLITCVLSSLATTGYSLTCIECTSQNDQICNGTSVTCPPGHYSCILSYGVTTLAEMKISNIYIRQCGESSLCSRAGTMSVPNGRLKTSTTCCDTDNCTPPQPVLSEDTNGKNGLKCKGCFSPNSKTCQTETVMDCTGKETMCMTQLTSTSGSIFSTTISRGCSTKEMCQPTHQVWNLGAMVVNVESKCANSGVYLHQSLFLLIISVCLFLKLMC